MATERELQEYAYEKKLNVLFRDMLENLFVTRPDDPVRELVLFLKKREPDSLDDLFKPVFDADENEDSESDTEEEEEEEEEAPEVSFGCLSVAVLSFCMVPSCQCIVVRALAQLCLALLLASWRLAVSLSCRSV